MRKLLILLILFFSCNVYGSYNVEELVLKANIDARERVFDAQAVFHIVGSGANIELYLYEGAKINKVLIENQKVDFSFAKGKVLVKNPDLKNFKLLIDYQFSLPKKDIDNIPSTFEDPSVHIFNVISEDFVYLGKEFFWYPRATYLYQKVKIFLSSKDGLGFVTLGELTEYKKEGSALHSSWHIDKPQTGLTLIGGRFEVNKREYKGRVKLYTFFSEENRALSERYLDAVYRYLELYEEKIGIYPYEKFAVVESKTPVGLSYPSLTLIGKNILKLPFIIDTSLPHEIVHCYFGNGVFVDFRKGNWSEGLATYLADYYIKELKDSKEALNYRKKLVLDYASLVDSHSEIPLSKFFGRVDVSTRAIGYGKSAMFYHYLRYMLGDEIFFKALSTFFKDNLFKKAGWDELKKSFEEVSRRDLSGIFLSWVEKKGVPDIEIDQVKLDRDQGEYLVTISLKQKGKIYDLLVPVWFEFEDGEKNFVQNVSLFTEKEKFRIRVKQKPRYVLIDPEFHLIKSIEKDDVPPSVNNLKAAREVFIVKNKNYKGTERSINILLSTLGIERHTPISAKADTILKKPIIYFGYDELELNNFRILKDGFLYKGEKFAEKDTLFLVFYDKNKNTVAIFLPLSQEVSEKVASKITHYGQFGYLIFRDGNIYQKGTWEIDLSRLKKEL